MYPYPHLKPESVVVSTAPTDYPVTLDEAKLHARISGSDEDSEIQNLIAAATAYVQEYQWSQLISATHVMRLDRFPCGKAIELWPNPVQSVTSVQYVDTSGNTQTLAASTNYTADVYSKPARIVPAYTLPWPATRCYINDVTVTYVTGWGASGASVPITTRQAILLLVGHWFRNREATGTAAGDISFAVKALLDLNSYRTFY